MNFFTFFKQNKLMFLLLIAMIMMVIVSLSVILMDQPVNKEIKTTPPIPEATPLSDLNTSGLDYGTSEEVKNSLISVTPSVLEPLVPGVYPTITLNFKENTSSNFASTVLFTSFIDSSTKNIKVNTSAAGKQLIITFTEPVEGYGSYRLRVTDSGAELFTLDYLSDKPQATPVAKNNTSLAQYLPYKTETYTLTYIPEENKYLFSFIYNSNSDKDTGTQFDEAKAQAIQFIRNRGIDPNSLFIEWSFH